MDDDNVVKFKFPLFVKVRTLLDIDGLITMRAQDEGGIKYWVQTATGSNSWCLEDHLSSI